jgi:hypothetical protein
MVVALCLMETAWAVEPPSPEPAKVSAEQLQKLITQLGDTKFQVRQQATAELSRLGRAALRALQEASANHKDAEVRKRATALVEEIQGRDRPRVALLTVLARLQETKPPPSDRQLAVAMYLLSLSRHATEAEIADVEKRLKAAKDRAGEAEEMMWSLLTGREFNEKLAEITLKVADLRQSVGGMNLAERLARLNGEEQQKIMVELNRKLKVALDKRSDAQVVDTFFLVFLARFPSADETARALAHIKKTDPRDRALEDLIWALMNTKEFLMGR